MTDSVLTGLAFGLAALLLALARTVVHRLVPGLAFLLAFRWLSQTLEGRHGLNLLDAAALFALWIYPFNVLDFAAVALALWAAFH